MSKNRMMIFSGNSNPNLAQAVAQHLNLSLGQAHVGRFSDGEVMVEILENLRGNDVFILQPTSAPTNDHLMELLVLADAARRASAARITAVVPYLGYSRQDRRSRSARVPITAKVVANMISAVGVDRVLTMDLHADQIQGYFDIPVDNIYASPILFHDIKENQKVSNLMVVSPDVGGVVRARAMAKYLDTELAIIDKRRPRPNEAKIMHIIGDVKNRTCLIVDDLVDTAGTLCAAARALKKHGAKAVKAYCTHPVLSGAAIDNINHSELDELVVTNTIRLNESAKHCNKIRQLSIASMLAETMRRIHAEESVSELFIQD